MFELGYVAIGAHRYKLTHGDFLRLLLFFGLLDCLQQQSAVEDAIQLGLSALICP